MKASHDLFCYGTLEFPAVMEAVAGRRFPALKAVLPGYRRLAVKGRAFPGAIAQAGADVGGTLYRGLTAAHLRRLDVYETALYRRRRLRVRDAAGRSRRVWAYVVPLMYRHRLGTSDWSPAAFLRCDHALHVRRLRRRRRGGMVRGCHLG